METQKFTNIAASIHISSLLQYLIPFGNFIFPIILWTSKKDQSEFVDHNGKQLINFQLSILIYSLLLILIAIPILIHTLFKNTSVIDLVNNLNQDDFSLILDFSNNIELLTLAILSLIICFFIKIAEFYLIILATVKTSNGAKFYYPLTIPFLR